MTWRNTRCGLFLALLAIVAQLGWNARVPDMPRVEMAVLLGDAGAHCHDSGGAGGHKSPAIPGQDCPMCVCCMGTIPTTALLVPIIFLLLPTAISHARFVVTPPATVALPVRFAIARPRGPPARV
jgi:hypothetical protein